MPNAPLVSFSGERAKIPLPLRVLGRYFVTGAPLRGPGDNATLLHRATVDYRARPYLTLTGPLWHRLARRNGAVTVPILLTAASATPWVGLWVVATYEGLLLLAAFAWLVARTRKAHRDSRRNREWIDPAAHRLCNILKHRYIKANARQLISIPRDWGQDREGGEQQSATVYLPEGTVLSKAIKTAIEMNVGAALGIPAPVSALWAENGSRVEMRAAPLPPATVTWAEMATAMAECPDDEIIVGRKTGGHFVKISLSEDAPHVLASGAAGTGKSVLLRVILHQRLMRGDGVMIFDPKRFSHMRWASAYGRDRVIYSVTDQELHAGWLAVGDEMRRRISLPLDELEHQRRVWLVAEEINAQIKILTRFWKAERQRMMRPAAAMLSDAVKECGGSKVEGLQLALDNGLDMAELDPPLTSPAIVALQETVFMGRELKMHMLAAAQRASAGVFGGGGGDVRESFQGGRFMAKWDRKLWKMLADGVPYVAWPGGPRGVWGLARGDDFDIFRVPFMSEEEMATVLSSGQAVHGPVLGVQTGRGQLDTEVVHVQELATGVSLAKALDSLPGQDGPAALTLATLRWHAGRPGFPVAVDKLDGQPYGKTETRMYDLDSLINWRLSTLGQLGQ